MRGVFWALGGALFCASSALVAQTRYSNEGSGATFFDLEQGGDPLLCQHVVWFLGHPETWVVLLSLLIYVAVIVVGFVCGPRGLRILALMMIAPMTLAIVAALAQVMTPDGGRSGGGLKLLLGPLIGACGVSAIWVFIALAKARRREVFGLAATIWLGAAGAALTAAIGLSITVISKYAGDGAYHDSYYAVATVKLHFYWASLFFLVAGVYAVAPKIFGAPVNVTGALIHLALFTSACALLLWSSFASDGAGMPRRYIDQSDASVIATFAHAGSWLNFASWLWFLGALIWNWGYGCGSRRARTA